MQCAVWRCRTTSLCSTDLHVIHNFILIFKQILICGGMGRKWTQSKWCEIGNSYSVYNEIVNLPISDTGTTIPWKQSVHGNDMDCSTWEAPKKKKGGWPNSKTMLPRVTFEPTPWVQARRQWALLWTLESGKQPAHSNSQAQLLDTAVCMHQLRQRTDEHQDW